MGSHSQQQQQRTTLSEAVRTFVPGITQGATTVLLGHPLDTAKTRMQAVGPHVKSSVFQTMLHIVRHEGVRGLYRGAAPPILMEGAKRGVQFALWDVFRSHSSESKKGVDGRGNTSSSSSSSSSIHHNVSGMKPPNGNMTTTAEAEAGGVVESPDAKAGSGGGGVKRVLGVIGSSTFLSGSVAGGIGTLIGCPMHVIKIQTQNQTAGGTRNAWTCTNDIWRREGFRGFYRGLKANMLKDVCFSGTYLSLYTHLKGKFHNARAATTATMTTRASETSPPLNSSSSSTRNNNVGPATSATYGTSTSCSSSINEGNDALGTFLAGSVACMITWIMLYPLDTMKTLIQSKRLPSISAVSAAHIPFREIYRGMTASLWRAGPIAGIAMMVYENSKKALQ